MRWAGFNAARRTSSPFTTTSASLSISSSSSVLALSTPSRSCRAFRWERPMRVYTAMSGRAILPRRVISPKSLMPSSTTAAWVPASRRKRVSGTPSSLFKLPSVRRVLNSSARTQAHISLVVVFPELPTMPTTGPEKRSRHSRASSAMARATSGTTITPPSTPSGTLAASAQGAPLASAEAM